MRCCIKCTYKKSHRTSDTVYYCLHGKPKMKGNTMHSVTIQEADGHLNELAELVDQGEEVELVRPGKPSLKIVIEKPADAQQKRQFGQYKGQSWHMSDDFDTPLPDSLWLGDDKA